MEQPEVVEESRFPDFVPVAPKDAECSRGIGTNATMRVRIGSTGPPVYLYPVDLRLRQVATGEQ
jgi:hypothetical protein